MHCADYAVERCLSVRPSVCHTCVNTAKPIIVLFHRRVAHHSMSFSYQTGWQYSDWNLRRNGDIERRRYKKLQFLTNISFYLENDTR